MSTSRALNVSGKPSFLFGGEFHYFRIPRSLWSDRLTKAKAAFLDIIGSYIPWNLHEPGERTLDFEGGHDLSAWIECIKEQELLFFARPGPYICSEWDMGGLPPWLIGKVDAVRTTDPDYMAAVRRWFSEVNRILRDFLPGGDGNLVLYQIENEFLWGELPYFLQMVEWLQNDNITVPVLTNLNPAVRKNTLIADTLDLYPGPWNIHKTETAITDLLFEQPEKLAGCVEFQMGFAAETGSSLPSMAGAIPENWVELHVKNSIARGLNFINFFMFCGGTSWGYYPGRSDITSYDYDSAIREWGELSGKYYMARRMGSFLHTFGDYLVHTLPDREIPVEAERGVSVLRRVGKDCAFIFPRNLRGTPEDITFTLDMPDDKMLDIPVITQLHLPPQSMKMIPVNIPLSDSVRLVYCTSEIFGVFRLEEELIVVIYDEPGVPGEIALQGFESYDHIRGDAAVETIDGFLRVSFLHRSETAHLLLAGKGDDDMSSVMSGIRIILTDKDTAARTWTGIRGDDEFPILSNVSFMHPGTCDDDILRIPVSLLPGIDHVIEFPCNFTPVLPPTVFFDNDQIENISANKILKTIRAEIPAFALPEIENKGIGEWFVHPEEPLNLTTADGWKQYKPFCGNEHSNSFEAGYYSYRCSFGFDGDPSGKKIYFTGLHDNAVVYLNGVCLGGVTGRGNNGSRFSADVSETLNAGNNELFVQLECEGRPRKGDEAAVTGITGPVVLTETDQALHLDTWKRTILRFETESMLSAVPNEAEVQYDDSNWDTITVKKGWDSRIPVPPSTTFIEHGHERLYVVYRNRFSISDKESHSGLLLDVGQADGKCWIFLNGRCVGKKHQERYCADLTPFVTVGENVLVIILRNFRWYTTIGLHGEVILRKVERVLSENWTFIKGNEGEHMGLPEWSDSENWLPLETQELPEQTWLAAAFTYEPPKGWTAPVGLYLSGWNANINIYLNGFLVGRYHPEGPQERFYLPEDRIGGNNRLVLFCHGFGKQVKIGSAEIFPYYMVKEGMLEIRF